MGQTNPGDETPDLNILHSRALSAVSFLAGLVFVTLVFFLQSADRFNEASTIIHFFGVTFAGWLYFQFTLIFLVVDGVLFIFSSAIFVETSSRKRGNRSPQSRYGRFGFDLMAGAFTLFIVNLALLVLPYSLAAFVIAVGFLLLLAYLLGHLVGRP